MQRTRENEIIQALAKEYLQEDRKGERENTLTASIMCAIGALCLGIALGSYSIYQSPQQQNIRNLQQKAQQFDEIKHKVCN